VAGVGLVVAGVALHRPQHGAAPPAEPATS
jgi:hypothetical protein